MHWKWFDLAKACSLAALDEEREEAALEAKEALATLREMTALRWKGVDTKRFVQNQMLVRRWYDCYELVIHAFLTDNARDRFAL